jgi:hypothetical protein
VGFVIGAEIFAEAEVIKMATLDEIVAWSAAANLPADGDVATIESILAEFQILQNRTNFLKSDTTYGVTYLKAGLGALAAALASKKTIVGSDNLSSTISWSAYSGTDWTSASSLVATISTPFASAKAGDEIQVVVLLHAYMATSGAGMVRIAWVDDGSEVDPTTVTTVQTAVSNYVTLVASHTVIADAPSMVIRGIGSGSVAIHVENPYEDNSNVGTYQVHRNAVTL